MTQLFKHYRGLIWVSGYFDGWLPACAGMTGFFVMYRGPFGSVNNFVEMVKVQSMILILIKATKS